MTETQLHTIDCHYVEPGLACAYLRLEGEEAAFIETNTTHAVPRLLEALEAAGRARESVRYIIVTHVHLDHAGGASALAAACPNATVLAHPRAARHLIDPDKLVRSASAVYGEERFRELYGEILPIDAARVRSLEDGDEVELGGAPLHFHHTRGHANHHFVVHDPKRDTVYTGDTFGLAYPRLQRGGRFAYPSTSPTDFDAAAAHESVKKVLALGTSTVCLTHFGEIDQLEETASQLHRWLDRSADLFDQARGWPEQEREKRIYAGLEQTMNEAAEARGLELDEADRALMAFDLDLNAQGIAFAVTRAEKKAEG